MAIKDTYPVVVTVVYSDEFTNYEPTTDKYLSYAATVAEAAAEAEDFYRETLESFTCEFLNGPSSPIYIDEDIYKQIKEKMHDHY